MVSELDEELTNNCGLLKALDAKDTLNNENEKLSSKFSRANNIE